MVDDGQQGGADSLGALGWVVLPFLVLAVYWPSMTGEFVWDDDKYVSENAAVQAADGLGRIWFTTESPQYYPLVFTTFWAEWHLWGENTVGYHLVNVALHALNSLLFWRVLRQLGLAGAWAAAAVFALHPIHVESVAWITERKNVLSGLFYLFAFSAYWRFAERGRWGWYAAALLSFACALLSKTTTVMLPAVLMVALWWGRKIWNRRVLCSAVPLFGMSLAMSALTVWYEKVHVGAEGVEWSASAAERIANSGRIVWFYLYKVLVPYGFSFTYPRWEVDARSVAAYVPLAALIVVLAVLILRRNKTDRHFLAALVAFVVSLFPVLGFFDIYFMRYSLVADHFAYLPAMCLIVLVVCGVAHLLRSRPGGRAIGTALCLILMGVLGVESYAHTQIFRDKEALYQDIIRKNPSSWLALNNLGNLLLHRGENREAGELFGRARRSNPILQEPYDNERRALVAQGRYAEAIEVAREGKDRAKDNVRITLELARLLGTCPDASVRDGQEAVIWARVVAETTLHGESHEALDVLGCAYAENGEFGNAVRAEQRAIDKAHESDASGMAEVYRERLALFAASRAYHEGGVEARPAKRPQAQPVESGATSRLTGTQGGAFALPLPRRADQWEPELRRALEAALERIRSEPNNARNVGLLGMLYQANLSDVLALPCYERAVELAPETPKWHYLMAMSARSVGRADLVREGLSQALRLEPNLAPAMYYLGEIEIEVGNLNEAAMLFERMTRVWPTSAGGYFGLGRVEERREHETEARLLLAKALKRAPGNGEILHRLGTVFARISRSSGDTELGERAREYLASARSAPEVRLFEDRWRSELQKMPVSSALLAQRAALLEEGGQLTAAAGLLEEAVRRRPDLSRHLIQLARVRYKQGQMDRSRELCERATFAAPDNFRNWTELAELCREMERYEEAWSAALRALELAPEDVKVMYLAARILTEAGQLEDAAEGFDRVLARDANHTGATVRLADVLLELGRNERALSVARRAVELAPESGRARYALGVALWRTGDTAGGEREWKAAVMLSPDNRAARERLNRVIEQVRSETRTTTAPSDRGG